MTEVRTRIAPSPTGDPHVGTAYIALFNWVFARANHGKFILRIEDTDQTRSRPQYEDAILRALKWVGIGWDEGPDIGGPYAPYRQSERTEIYRRHADVLLAKGAGYRCFCTPERLAGLRQDKDRPGYDGSCRRLSPEEAERKLSDGLPFVVRLRVPDAGTCVIKDRMRGDVTWDYARIDDQVLLKSDGFPTYHLANVVDDHLMAVSHVIRGEEWISSTPKHILIYEAFGWQMPEFIHLSLLKNPDGTKLSKRKNPTSILYYRDAGFLPEALVNYLGLMGYSMPDEREKFTPEEMAHDFDPRRLGLGGSIFDLKKLSWLSGRYMREDLTEDDIERRLSQWRLNQGEFRKLVPLMRPRLEALGDFLEPCAFIFSRRVSPSPEDLVPKGRETAPVTEMLQATLWLFESEEALAPPLVEQRVRQLVSFTDWKIREVTGVLFVAVMGRKVGPPLYESIAILGRELFRVRLLDAIEALGGLSKNKTKALDERFRKWMAEGGGRTEEPAE